MVLDDDDVLREILVRLVFPGSLVMLGNVAEIQNFLRITKIYLGVF